MFNLGHAQGHELEHQGLAQLLLKNNNGSGLWANRPTAPVDGQRFFATDAARRIEYEWDNTVGQWLSIGEYLGSIATITLAATGQVSIPVPVGTWYISQLDLNITQVNAGSGVNFWSWVLAQFGGITSGTVDTKLQSAGVGAIYSYTAFGTTLQNPASLPNGRATLTFTQNNVGAGNLTVFGAATLRKVG